jgi:hypothetical protein
MARFRLLEKHYLNIEGSEWEEKQELLGKVRGKNRLHRRRFDVPMYFDPKDQSDHNYPDQIIVATEESRLHPDDYILRKPFIPTMDMEPLDAEAEAILADYKANFKGEHPIESLSTSYGEQLLDKLSRQLEEAMGPGGSKIPKGVPSVSVAEFEQLKKDKEELAAKVDQAMAMLAAMQEQKPEAPTRRI